MTFNLITVPLFTAGILTGLNKRLDFDFSPDPRAHYKLMSMAAGLGAVKGLASYMEGHSSTVKPRFSSSMLGGGVGGLLASGTAYCMGLMLTKIPSKNMAKKLTYV